MIWFVNSQQYAGYNQGYNQYPGYGIFLKILNAFFRH